MRSISGNQLGHHTLVVGNDLDAAILVDTDARVSRSQVDSHNRAVDLALVVLLLGRPFQRQPAE